MLEQLGPPGLNAGFMSGVPQMLGTQDFGVATL